MAADTIPPAGDGLRFRAVRRLPLPGHTLQPDFRPDPGGFLRKSKFSEEQIIGIVKEAGAGVEIAALLRRHGISRATLYQWRSKYAGATVSDVKRIKELEAENSKLKRMYADLALENTAIKDVLNRKL